MNPASATAPDSTHHPGDRGKEDTVSGQDTPRRLLLWVDAVGGFLVILNDRIELGQPVPGRPIAVPILADLSRRHAVIHRDGGRYVLDPVQQAAVDGRALTGPTVLATEQSVQLGDSVKLRFRQPHALSSTAVLRMESGHRTQPTADGVVLMADSCILGPSSHSHIRCRNWERDVILFRQGDQLYCRSSAPLIIDSAECPEGGAVQGGSRIEGDEFSFYIEAL